MLVASPLAVTDAVALEPGSKVLAVAVGVANPAAAPVLPLGIVKSKIGWRGVPELTTIASVPSAPVVVWPTSTVGKLSSTYFLLMDDNLQ